MAKSYFRSRFRVCGPTHIFGKDECIQGDNMTIRQIITNFTLPVIKDEFENKERFFDFDINSFVDDSLNIDVDRLVRSLDRFVPLREMDIEAANAEVRMNFYRDYAERAKAYFHEKEASQNSKEASKLENQPVTEPKPSVEDTLQKIVDK